MENNAKLGVRIIISKVVSSSCFVMGCLKMDRVERGWGRGWWRKGKYGGKTIFKTISEKEKKTGSSRIR